MARTFSEIMTEIQEREDRHAAPCPDCGHRTGAHGRADYFGTGETMCYAYQYDKRDYCRCSARI